MKKYLTLVILIFLLPALSACRERLTAEQKQAIRAKLIDNLVFVQGGSFMMGDAGAEFTDENGKKFFAFWTGDRDTKPAHNVTLDSYSMMKFEATYEDYDLFCKVTGHQFAREKSIGHYSRTPDLAAAAIPWQDAKDYCLWLSDVTDLPCDLPTEAQWEYAARSRGLNVGYATDNGKLDFRRNYRGKGAPWHPQPPGTYPPNPLGLYDMTGNVCEWVDDWYAEDYYSRSPEHNPGGPESGNLKIMRGFDVIGSPSLNLLFRRMERPPESKDGAGIRCVVNLPEPVKQQ